MVSAPAMDPQASLVALAWCQALCGMADLTVPQATHHSLTGQDHLTTLQPAELGGPGGFLLPVSQVGPPKPAGHWQLKLLMPCVQVPPF